MGSDENKKQMRALFSGRVQGVGFRYRVSRTAPSFNVTGFVQNLEDGDVEVVAEGIEQDLVDFLHAIRESYHITREQLRWNSATEKYDSFRISY